MCDFNRHSNICFYIRNVLFHKYCTAFYGSQVLPMFGDCMQELYTAWRIAVHRVWRVLFFFTSHCTSPTFGWVYWYRIMVFYKMAMKSDNVVWTVINMGIGGSYSVMGRNIRLMKSRFKMEERNVLKFGIITDIASCHWFVAWGGFIQ